MIKPKLFNFMYEDPRSKISQLQKILDAKEDRVTKKIKRHELHDRDTTLKHDWGGGEPVVGGEVFSSAQESISAAQTIQPAKNPKSSFPLKILFGSIVFFILALCVVAYKFLGGGNIVSSDNIQVTVQAPISVAGGEVMPFEIDIKNNNNTTLSGADLGVVFPSGAKEALDTSLQAKNVQSFIGDILPGQTVKKNLSVALFGSENEKKDINLTLEYKVAGSNSLFNKTKAFSVLISSSPVNIVVTGPAEVNTNQLVNYSVDVTSNSPTVAKDLLLRVEYPFGFAFTRSDPNTFSKNNSWLLGDLAPGEKRTIKFSGTLSGQEGEERGFNFSIGSQSKTDTSVIGVPFASSFSSVTIRRPFVSADISLNGDNGLEYVSTAGSKVEALINWQNNLAYEVSDVSIVVKLSGNSLNKSAVQADGGLYRSIDNTIIFNKTTDSALASLSPGQTGASKFTFSSFGIGTVTGASLVNPTIVLDISVSGQRVNYQGNQGDILFSDSRKVKITANPQLSAKALYNIGPFQNSGPIPPVAEKETTYTITWTVTNPLNNLSGASVSATLPPYMKWLGAVSPDREKVSYDQGTGLVTWNVGNVLAGAGTVNPAKEVSFQVSFLPSVDQIGSVPNLIGDASLTARDSFTLTDVGDSFTALNTRLTSDPYFKAEAETVIQ